MSNTTPVDVRKQNAADKRATRRASRAAIAEHNARVFAQRESDARNLAAHILAYGEDGFECA